MSKTKPYELVYFNARPRGEPSRLAFAVAGIEFDDTRITFPEWSEEKKKAPQGRLPYLVIRGKTETKISQSLTILRYLGKQFGLYPGKDEFLQQAYVDQVIDTCTDLMADWQKAFFQGKDDAEKAKLKEDFKKETVPKFYGMLEVLLKDNKDRGCKEGYAVGNKLSVADLLLYNTIETCNEFAEVSLDKDKYHCLLANRALVEKNPKIAAYLKTRPKTDF